LEELLRPQGIAMSWKRAKDDVGLGARLRNAGGYCTIATVYEGGAAHQAGLSAGDLIVAVGGLRVQDDKSLQSLLSRWQDGQAVTVHVFRRDELREFPLALATVMDTECELKRV